MIADAGFLFALERRQRDAWSVFRSGLDRYGPTLLPATVLAQAWRGGSGRQHPLTSALDSCTVEDLDERAARRVGEVLAEHGGSDIAEGHVVALSDRHPERPVATSDRRDLEALGVPAARILDV